MLKHQGPLFRRFHGGNDHADTLRQNKDSQVHDLRVDHSREFRHTLTRAFKDAISVEINPKIKVRREQSGTGSPHYECVEQA
jgi:hypothetical protein